MAGSRAPEQNRAKHDLRKRTRQRKRSPDHTTMAAPVPKPESNAEDDNRGTPERARASLSTRRPRFLIETSFDFSMGFHLFYSLFRNCMAPYLVLLWDWYGTGTVRYNETSQRLLRMGSVSPATREWRLIF